VSESERAAARARGSQQADAKAIVHAEPIERVLERCGGDPSRGLTSDEAEKRLAELGRNELPKQARPSALSRILAQFANPIVLTLLVAAVIALVNGASRAEEPLLVRFGDAIAIFLIVLLNAVLGFYQERRAEQALDALEKMQSTQARVMRDEKVISIDAAEVTVGDLLELEAGDAVPADARLLQAINLAVEESSLTGESMPAGKDARAALPPDAPLGDRSTMLFLGTSIVRGKGRAIVVATGVHTELGKLSVLIHKAGDRTTPLEDKLAHFGKRILWACLALSALLFLRGAIKGDRPLHELLLEAVSLAVAAIPEGLPAITTITLALGMQRMAKRGAIIRKLAAVETLGAATVICSDKTGTLTKNEMTVREIFTGGERFDVSGVGYAPDGAISRHQSSIAGDHIEIYADAPSSPLNKLLATVALCNNATLSQDAEGKWKITGDPTEAALLTLATKGGSPKNSVMPGLQVLKEVPFDSDRKRMTVVTLDARGREVVHTKGSADILLPLCSTVATAHGVIHLDDEERARILGEAERMSGEALRVLAVARRDLDRGESDETKEDHHGADLEKRLTFLGLVGMIDPPREGVKEAIRSCAEAQVRAVMITGDHKLTAIAIARELGLWESDLAGGPRASSTGPFLASERGGEPIALSGSELEALSDEEIVERINRVRVFARVTAEQKLRIVRLFKRAGHIVAMTGDGVNDAPALREAHIGVAMGKDGTDVARQAADMVLADDNFATIVDAVREGRAIWRNIQKFIFFLLSSNAGLLVTVFAASFLRGLPPLTPLMILWINLVTNGLPALALGVDPPDPTQMMEAPRKAQSGLLSARDYLAILGVGVWMGGTALACYLWRWQDPDGEVLHHARAIAFSLLALSPLFHAFNCRSPSVSVFAMRPLVSKPLVAAVVLSGAIHLVAVLVPSLRPVFRTYRMSSYEWGVMLLLSASIIPVIELSKFFQRVFWPTEKPPAPRRDAL
jgi:P-type Ca2+ transporter type 2C